MIPTSGMESVLESMASNLDGTPPQGRDWHQELIEQMAAEFPGVRPAMLSRDLADQLHELRRFRHIVRIRYGAEIELERTAEIFDVVRAAFPAFRAAFESLAQALERPAE